MPPRSSQPVSPSQSRAKIEIWREDIGRLWGAPESSGNDIRAEAASQEEEHLERGASDNEAN